MKHFVTRENKFLDFRQDRQPAGTLPGKLSVLLGKYAGLQSDRSNMKEGKHAEQKTVP